MKLLFVLVPIIGLLQVTGAAKDAAIKKDRDALQGMWTVITIAIDGKDVDVTKLVGARIIFEGEKAIGKVIRLGKGNECNFKLDPTVNPKRIDFVHADGTVTPGIYLLDDNKLKICNTDPKSPRPTTFESKAKSNNVLIILRRER